MQVSTSAELFPDQSNDLDKCIHSLFVILHVGLKSAQPFMLSHVRYPDTPF